VPRGAHAWPVNYSGGGSVTVPVAAPYTFFTDRINQVDLRVTKTIPFESKHFKGRLELMADLYNAFNTSPVLSRNAAIGARFIHRPRSCSPGS